VTVKFRWYLAAMICLPLISITVYLLWLWPTPGTSELAEFVPYLLSLLTGPPFFSIVSRAPPGFESRQRTAFAHLFGRRPVTYLAV
jgi:hypothetical protein